MFDPSRDLCLMLVPQLEPWVWEGLGTLGQGKERLRGMYPHLVLFQSLLLPLSTTSSWSRTSFQDILRPKEFGKGMGGFWSREEKRVAGALKWQEALE